MAMDWKPARRSTHETLISKHEMILPQRLLVLLVIVIQQFCLRGVVVENMPAIFFSKTYEHDIRPHRHPRDPEVTVNSLRASENNRPAISRDNLSVAHAM